MAASLVRVALIEDEALVRRFLEGVLVSAGHDLDVFDSGDAFLAADGPDSYDVVVTDFQMPGASGLDVLKACLGAADPAAVILVTGFGSIRAAVEAIGLGAFDYLAKPIDAVELLHRVAQAIEGKRLRWQIEALSRESLRREGPAAPIAESGAMKNFLVLARRAAASSSTVLLVGETGTGKEVAARYLVSHSPRAGRAFLTLNCAALPENLLESELFGHARGAFSGAHALKRGLFEEASGGTLFLDEVGSMSLAAQAKLLRVLEEDTVRRVGENRPIGVDVRIMAATNRDLNGAIQSGEFRDDLYYRLSVVTLVVPPLRERRKDIEPLARQFLAEAVRRTGRERVFAPETLTFLNGYQFQGNVRELRYGIEQAVVLSEGRTLKPGDFPFSSARQAPAGSASAAGGRRSRPITEEVTAEMLAAALAAHRGNRNQAARALGISRATLYRLLRRDDSRGTVSRES
ncbi:MAG TPA: sigma-54 dependent transcriptional regulator [Thermoanaerobaculia bacterium]|nr:sigma-54 dependent transcriptional regulator [Thermoanaerobaculia bacterium]